MPIDPNQFRTGGALQGAIAASLVRERDAAAELASGTQIGIYRVLRELARGGMAIVYLAERADGEYEQQVALKWMLQAQPDAASEALFRRERQALADLRHPHIARLLDGGRTDEGRPWFAMELIAGERLDRHCLQAGLPLRQRLGLFQQVCAAVAFAHARGVIHRDIKPSNVMVDVDGSAKLLDFGIAQLLGQDDGLATRAYTPGFASPEQVRGEPLTVASDVYQLGRLLASLLSGDEHEQTAMTASTTSLPEMSDDDAVPVPRRIPADLVAILRKASASDREQRYSTADALADDVQAFIERRPVRALPRTGKYVAARYAQRHPLGVAAAVLALVVVTGGSTLFTWRLRIERDAAGYQAKVATSVLDFLQDDLLATADPATARGREVTVREALDLASKSAGQRLAQAPVELGAVRATLARLYYKLGRYGDAEREARQAIATSAAPDAPQEQLLRVQATLADALISQERLDEVDPLLADVAAGWTHLKGADSREALDARFSAGHVLEYRGDYEAAERLFARVAEDARRSLGANDELTLSITSKRASNLQTLGRYQEALTLLETAHAASVTSRGIDHPQTLETAHNIGAAMLDLGRTADALHWLEATLAGSRKVIGIEHPATLSTANVLARAYGNAQRFEQAEALYEEVLQTRLRVLGEENMLTRVTMGNFGQFYLERQQVDLAAPLLERALALDLRLLGEGHPETLASMNASAKLYRAQRRFDDAIVMHRRVLAGVGASLGADAWQAGMAHAGFATTLETALRYDEADSEYAQALSILQKSLGGDDPRTKNVLASRVALAERGALQDN